MTMIYRCLRIALVLPLAVGGVSGCAPSADTAQVQQLKADLAAAQAAAESAARSAEAAANAAKAAARPQNAPSQ